MGKTIRVQFSDMPEKFVKSFGNLVREHFEFPHRHGEQAWYIPVQRDNHVNGIDGQVNFATVRLTGRIEAGKHGEDYFMMVRPSTPENRLLLNKFDAAYFESWKKEQHNAQANQDQGDIAPVEDSSDRPGVRPGEAQAPGIPVQQREEVLWEPGEEGSVSGGQRHLTAYDRYLMRFEDEVDDEYLTLMETIRDMGGPDDATRDAGAFRDLSMAKSYFDTGFLWLKKHFDSISDDEAAFQLSKRD